MKTLTLSEAADYLGRDKGSIDGYRKRNNFPQPHGKEMRRGKLVNVWTDGQLDSWNPVANRKPKNEKSIYGMLI